MKSLTSAEPMRTSPFAVMFRYENVKVDLLLSCLFMAFNKLLSPNELKCNVVCWKLRRFMELKYKYFDRTKSPQTFLILID